MCLNRNCTYVHLKYTRRTEVPQEENKGGPSSPNKETATNRQGQPRLRFDSLASVYTPYPPTINRAQPRQKLPTIEDEHEKDSNSFLLHLIENMKKGISEQISELRDSIPTIVKELIPVNAQPPQPQGPIEVQRQLQTYLLPQMMNHHMSQYVNQPQMMNPNVPLHHHASSY